MTEIRRTLSKVHSATAPQARYPRPPAQALQCPMSAAPHSPTSAVTAWLTALATLVAPTQVRGDPQPFAGATRTDSVSWPAAIGIAVGVGSLVALSVAFCVRTQRHARTHRRSPSRDLEKAVRTVATSIGRLPATTTEYPSTAMKRL